MGTSSLLGRSQEALVEQEYETKKENKSTQVHM